jgi:hypothetical protein
MNGNMINSAQQQRPGRNIYKWLVWALIVLVILGAMLAAAGLLGMKIWKKLSVKSEYQAVFLSNGQVYFGKLDYEHKWVILRDIYYLQVTEDLQPASNNSNATPNQNTSQNNQQQQIQLVKLGSELHGPQDEMFIDKSQILFWENMKDDSKVLQSIKQYKDR